LSATRAARQRTLRDAVDAVLFDFDGTLAELTIDFGEMRQRVQDLLADFGVPQSTVTARYVLELIDEGTAHLAANGGDGKRFHERAHAAIEAVELAAASRGRLIAGARATLGGLTETGVPFAIVTRNCRRAVVSLLDRENLACAVLLTRNDVPHVKPDPRHLDEALARLDCPQDRALMVGDHPMDMTTAGALGIRAIGVLTGSSTAESLSEAGALLVLPSVADLPAALDNGGHVL
jgi:phosphoglycolate phosphatase